MPKGTYSNPKKALKNANLIMKKTKCDAIKLESNKVNFKIIKALVKKIQLWDILATHHNLKANLN